MIKINLMKQKHENLIELQSHVKRELSQPAKLGTNVQRCPICGKPFSFRSDRSFCRYCEAVTIPLVVRALKGKEDDN